MAEPRCACLCHPECPECRGCAFWHAWRRGEILAPHQRQENKSKLRHGKAGLAG